jgi:integrase
VDKRAGGESVGGAEPRKVKREERVAEGVSLRRNAAGEPESIRISFNYRGVECREALKLAPTPPNIKYAVRLRGEILNAIGRGTFNYADQFPDSPRARQFGFAASSRTIGDMLRAQMLIWAPADGSRGSIEASTWLSYKRVIERHLLPWWGGMRARDLTPLEIRTRILSVEGISLKTARNILTPLSVVLTRAIDDDELQANPLDRVNLESIWPIERRETDWEADPFSFEEMLAIFGACRDDEEADYWRCAFGTGMRPSEQVALPWAHVDLVALTTRVEIAEVTGVHGARSMKGPKTKAGKRIIPMTRGALEAFQRQHERTGADGKRVWRDARYNAPWRGERPLGRRWMRILEKAGVRYRNPYQTRHTFASTLLAAGHPPLKVARWMGHETTEMLARNYGRWIEQGSNPETRAALEEFFHVAGPGSAAVVRIA